MEIQTKEYREILELMLKERWTGREYVAFPKGDGVISRYDIFTFDDQNEAKEFCDQMSTDPYQYDYLSIRSVYRTMSEALNDTNLLIEQDGIVSIGNMVSLYYARLEEQSVNNNQNSIIIKQKEDVMNEKNFDYLYNQIFYCGMNDITREQLKEQIISGKDEFQLSLDKKFGNDAVRAVLNFKKSDQNAEMYFYNSFDLILKKEGRDEALQHNFRVTYGNSFTMKEAYNMLDGRSVNKDFIKIDKDDRANNKEYNAWAYIDFKNTDDQGRFLISKHFNFDLEKAVGEYPIKNMEYPQNKIQMLESLKKGNQHYVTMETSRGDEKIYLEANPRYNSIKLYDEQRKPIQFTMKTESVKQEQQMEQGTSAEQKNGLPHIPADGKQNPEDKKTNKTVAGDLNDKKKPPAKRKSRGVA